MRSNSHCNYCSIGFSNLWTVKELRSWICRLNPRAVAVNRRSNRCTLLWYKEFSCRHFMEDLVPIKRFGSKLIFKWLSKRDRFWFFFLLFLALSESLGFDILFHSTLWSPQYLQTLQCRVLHNVLSSKISASSQTSPTDWRRNQLFIETN